MMKMLKFSFFLKYFSSFQQSYLKKYLKKDKINVAMAASGDAIPKTFLMSLVKLIGRCQKNNK